MFKSTPKTSLHVITEEFTLQIRRDKSNPKHYYNAKYLLQTPAFKFITPEQETPYSMEKYSHSLCNRKKIAKRTQFTKKITHIMPYFSFSLSTFKEPAWVLPSTRNDLPRTRHQLKFSSIDLNNRYKQIQRMEPYLLWQLEKLNGSGSNDTNRWWVEQLTDLCVAMYEPIGHAKNE